MCRWARIDTFFNRALIDASADAIRFVDLNGDTLLANALMDRLSEELFGVAKDATQAERTAAVARVADPDRMRAMMEAVADDPELSTRDEFELADGTRAFVRDSGPVRDASGVLIGRLIVMREITAERDAARLTFEAAAEREAARLRAKLVDTVSHELRTPLTSVLGFTRMLIAEDLDEATRSRYLTMIDGETRRLAALIDDFLAGEGAEAGRQALALESFPLETVLQHQVDIFSAQSTRHALEYVPTGERITVVADRTRLGQVLANLLSNAIKYSPAGGTVTLAVAMRDGFAHVSVVDDGLGISVDQQERIFSRFFRVESADTREIGGSGLGLAFCQEVVHAHGGRIGFESLEGAGSTFWFEVPTARPA